MLTFTAVNSHTLECYPVNPDFPVRLSLTRRQWEWAWSVEFYIPETVSGPYNTRRGGWTYVSGGQEGWGGFWYPKNPDGPKPTYLRKAMAAVEMEVVALLAELIFLAAAQKVVLESQVDLDLWQSAAHHEISKIAQKRREFQNG